MAGGEPRLGTTATYMRHNDHGTTHLSTEIDILHDLINDEYRVFSEGSVRKWSKFGLDTARRSGSLGDEQQVVRLTPAKWGADPDIGVPVGLGHAVVEQNTEHPVTEAVQPVVDCRSVALGFVPGLDHQCWAMSAEGGICAVEDLTLMPLDIDLDQIHPVQSAFGDERIETAE